MDPLCDWQTKVQNVIKRSEFLFGTGLWSDCQFIVGQESQQQIFKGHKVFLAMTSPVFEAMFFGSMAEKNDPIPITDVQPRAFRALLEYIYTNEVKLWSVGLACDLYYCAKKYMIPFLVKQSKDFLLLQLSSQNTCKIYEHAKLCEDHLLMKKCMHIIRSRTDEVLNESSWEDVELDTVLTVLEQNNLKLSSELNLFNAVERWAKSECRRKNLDPKNGSSLKSVIGNALSKIRFLDLNVHEFANGPAISPLLTQNESFAIIMNICSNKKIPMPEGFSTNINSRWNSTIRRINCSDNCTCRCKRCYFNRTGHMYDFDS